MVDLELCQIYDISPLLSAEIAVFPGDLKFSRIPLMSLAQGQNIDLSGIKTTLHVGAHADAPSHYGRTGRTMAQQELHYYFGRAQVIDISVAPEERIKRKHLKDFRIEAPRVLFRTGSFPDPNKWNSHFTSLSGELVDYLAQQKVKLVGIDTPSIDPETDSVLESHQRVLAHDMAILEGLDLAKVSAGIYTLIALPLKIAEAEASPVRAILLRE